LQVVFPGYLPPVPIWEPIDLPPPPETTSPLTVSRSIYVPTFGDPRESIRSVSEPRPPYPQYFKPSPYFPFAPRSFSTATPPSK
jgi:hypothetical protein